MEEKTDDIQRDEDPVEELRLKARVFGREEYDSLGQGDIDRGCVEHRSRTKAYCEELDVSIYLMKLSS